MKGVMTSTIRIASLNGGRRLAASRKLFLKLVLMLIVLLVVAKPADCQDPDSEISATPTPTATKIAPVDLHPGDILLYRFAPPPWDLPNYLVDGLIISLDGGSYNHASIYDGSNVLEAVGSGIVSRPVQLSIAHAQQVDVWRLHDEKDEQLGSPGFDAKPVTDATAKFAKNGGSYAYDKLLLLAGIVTTRRLKPSVGRELLLWILEQATLVLHKIIAGDKVQMICSELVYRCYLGASTATTDPRYQLKVPQVLKAALTQPVQDQAVKFWKEYQKQKAKDPLGPFPDFVTPHDLEASSNLTKVGSLK